jgi:serine/threonine-protein kinase
VLAAIDEIVMRGLSLDADARYASAEHMALALRAAATPAPASEIATWIQKVGSDALEAHAEVVRDAASQTLQAPAVVSTNPATPSGRRRFTAIVPVLAVAIVSLGLVAFERGRSVATAASGPSSPALSQVPAAPTSAVAASPPIAIPPDPTLSASSTPPTPRPPPIIPVSPKRASRATPNANAACNPPYTVDEQGVHQFKRECVVGR